MALEKYEGPGTVILDGDIQMEATSVTLTYASGANPVTTMRRGLAGRSLGPGMSSFEVNSAIPRAGMEGDVLRKCIRNADVRIVFVIAGVRYQVEGWIDEVRTTNSENAPAGVTFTGTGQPPTETG